MDQSRQRALFYEIVESVPGIAFVALWRSDVPIEISGTVGTLLAAAALIFLKARGQRFSPIVLGINLHLLLLAPGYVLAVYGGFPFLGDMLASAEEAGVLVAIFLVGRGYTAFSKGGFIGAEWLELQDRRMYSAGLLVLAGAAIPWSFAYLGNALVSIALPLMVLFGVRRFLLARAADRNGNSGSGLAGVALVPAADGGLD